MWQRTPKLEGRYQQKEMRGKEENFRRQSIHCGSGTPAGSSVCVTFESGSALFMQPVQDRKKARILLTEDGEKWILI